jgi:HNH endonuclease
MIPRRRFPNGKLEALTRFRRHRYCGPKCAGAARIGDPKRRLFASLKVDAPDKCWTWLGAKDRDGYGQLRFNYRHWKAHRFAYTVLVGPLPDDAPLDHTCKNPSCCNPAHLEVVMVTENNRRQQLHNPQQRDWHGRYA